MTGEFVRASPSVQHPMSPRVESHISGCTTRPLATCQEHPGLGHSRRRVVFGTPRQLRARLLLRHERGSDVDDGVAFLLIVRCASELRVDGDARSARVAVSSSTAWRSQRRWAMAPSGRRPRLGARALRGRPLDGLSSVGARGDRATAGRGLRARPRPRRALNCLAGEADRDGGHMRFPGWRLGRLAI